MSKPEIIELYDHQFHVDYTDKVSVPADALVHVLNEFLSNEPNWKNVSEPLGHLIHVLLDHDVHDEWAQEVALELTKSGG